MVIGMWFDSMLTLRSTVLGARRDRRLPDDEVLAFDPQHGRFFSCSRGSPAPARAGLPGAVLFLEKFHDLGRDVDSGRASIPSSPGEELTSITTGPCLRAQHVDAGHIEAHRAGRPMRGLRSRE